MTVTVTWRRGGSGSAGGISVRQVFDRSWGWKGCLLTVFSVWAVSPCLCASVVGPLGELQKSGKDLALLKRWAVIPQSGAELRQ